jgi:hypothetical protein
VFGCVLACGGVATANMTARLALAKSNPKSSFNEALLTGTGRFQRRKILGGQSVQMLTKLSHISSYQKFIP